MALLKDIQKLSSQEKKTLLEKAVKLQEELGELSEAILIKKKTSGSHYKKSRSISIQEETVDVLLVALDIFFSEGGTSAKLEKLLQKKALKWKKFQLK